MKRKKLLLISLLFFALGCTIIEDDYLEDLPEDVWVKNISILYYDDSAAGEPKKVTANVMNSSNKIELTFTSGIDFLFLNSKVSKITYQLNINGYAEKITSSFENGTIIVDDLLYNSKGQIIEMSNSFFKDKLKLFYKNNELDSVAKTRTLANNTTQNGFFKRTTSDNPLEEYFISIFPFDNTEPYTLDLDFYSCASGGATPDSNTVNKTSYVLSDSTQNSRYAYTGFQQILNSVYSEQYFNRAFESYYTNYFGKPDYLFINSVGCESINTNHVDIYSLFPEIVPDVLLTHVISIENSVKWMNSNSGKSPDFRLQSIEYSYEATK
jgi:hypothetical protein